MEYRAKTVKMRLMKRIIGLFWVILAVTAVPTTAFADESTNFNKAFREFKRDRPKSFALQARKIPADSAYQPLLTHWGAVIALRRARPEKLESLRQSAESLYIRRESARVLAKYYVEKGRWKEFAGVAEASPCSSLLAKVRQKTGKKALLASWDAETRFRSPLCNKAYQQARKNGMLSEEDFWIKLRNLAGGGLLSSTRRFLRNFRMPVSYRAVRNSVLKATGYIRGKHALDTPAQKSLVMIAAMNAAKRNVKLAVSRWRAFSSYFSLTENSQVWSKIGQRAALAHRADALELYKNSGDMRSYDENARAWRVRAALLVGDDNDVLRTINSMTTEQASLSAWRYWRAMALARTDSRPSAMKQMRALAADTDDYYGLLAREFIGLSFTVSEDSSSPAQEVGEDFAMALAVWRAGQTKLARQIWKDTVSVSDEGEILSAARAAESEKWYLASINAANVAKTPKAHALRYPTPYEGKIDEYSERFGLERAFVYALIRRESRFMSEAISSAKARGLMQILPSTARKVARRHGYNRYHPSRLLRTDTNIIIGTTYLRDLAKSFDAHPVRVATAYNAGPSRARRWRRDNIDTAALVENIPFLETRLYVKAVMAARAHYGLRFGMPREPMSVLIDYPMREAPKRAEI